jgi:threonylcarbamoyladenosine tRNA methylthiotransferase MtaB
MRIYLDQIGCRLNYSEMEGLARRLTAAGHSVVDEPGQAQVVIFNSCAVTVGAVRDSRKRVGALHRAAPAARIALTGCFATLDPSAAAAMPGVALVADNSQKELLPVLLEPWSAEFEDTRSLARLAPDANPFDFPAVVGEPSGAQASPMHASEPGEIEQARTPALQSAALRTRAFVKVQDGCNNRCTFCIVTSLRGDSRSRPLDAVVEEIGQHARQGIQEAVLTGVHLGAYGRDLPSSQTGNLKQLVTAILTHTDIARLRLSSLEPWELSDGFFELWARWPGRLCPHLHLPLQAGTDRQLRAMARRCTVDSYRQLLMEARAAIPDLTVTTDLIAGFPGESEADFAQGLAFVQDCRFAHAHVFPYSAREGTAAARFSDQVSPTVRKQRVQHLQAAVAATGREERLRFVGTMRPVLWEGRGKPVAGSGLARWTGLTDNYLRVQALAPAAEDWHNGITLARLKEASDSLELTKAARAFFQVDAYFVA